MTTFTDERVTAMERALARYLTTSRMFRNAGFSAALHSGDGSDGETVTITLADGRGVVGRGRPDAEPAFALRAAPEAWDGYFTGSGPVSRASVIGMALDHAISGGLLPAELAPEGDTVRLFANWPIVNRLLEAAADPRGSHV